jgi:lactate 2-monooxygenase
MRHQFEIEHTRGNPMKYFGQYENEIYSDGLRGVVPKLPIDIAELEKKAIAAWPDTIVSYVQGGCGDERTQNLNVAAF